MDEKELSFKVGILALKDAYIDSLDAFYRTFYKEAGLSFGKNSEGLF